MSQNKLLVDSDIYYSLIDRNDSNHKQVLLLNKKYLNKGIEFISLNLVIFETATVLSHKISQDAAVFFLQNTLSGKMEIIRLDELLEKEALKFFIKQQRKNVSYVDCANMALMKKLGLMTIFSFDKIYPKNGFKRIGID